jgi:hypothetical protein
MAEQLFLEENIENVQVSRPPTRRKHLPPLGVAAVLPPVPIMARGALLYIAYQYELRPPPVDVSP